MNASKQTIIRNADVLARQIRRWRREGETIALVSLSEHAHGGHDRLLYTAKKYASKIVVSIPGNSKESICESQPYTDCDQIYAPPDRQLKTHIHAEHCGLGHKDNFDRMLTETARLFGDVRPDSAVFGERDWVRLALTRRMVRDLSFPVTIVSAATLRDDDGLAVSSKNSELSDTEREIAPVLYKALTVSANLIAKGSQIEKITAATVKLLGESGFSGVEYVEARLAYDLSPVTVFSTAKPARLFAAVQLGRVRLTDNVPISV